MHPGLVMEGGVAGDRGIEGDVDPDHVGDHPVELGQDLEPVVRHQLGMDTEQPGDHAAERDDAIALADPQDGGIDVGGSRLERRECIGDGAARVVVGMELDVAVDRLAHHRDHLEDLVRRGDPDGVGQPDPLRVEPVDRLVDAQQVTRFRSKRVLAAEANLQSLRLDVAHDFGTGLDDLVNRLAARERPHGGRGAEQDVDAVGAGVDREPGVIEVTAHVGEHLGSQGPRRDGPQVGFGLGRGTGRRQLEVLNAELVEHLRDRDLLQGREVGRGELLAFPQR